jgi:uroporphyrinogen-III decarboxylase
MGGSGERLWERLHFLRGYENTMVDLAVDDPRLRKLIDIIVEYNIQSVNKFLKYSEVDCIVFQDDWGEQFRLMISPEMWREYFFEGYQKVFQAVRKAGKYVYFHTDGYLLPIVPDLIKAGVNIINLQSGSHRLEDLRAACMDKVCVSVDIDRQKVMPFGTPEEMKTHIREIYYVLEAWRGGVWAKMDVYPDTSLGNIWAMSEVFEELRSNI